MSRNDEKTLGVHLDLYSKYMESVKVGVLDFYVRALSLSLSHVLYLIQKKSKIYSLDFYIYGSYIYRKILIFYISVLYMG